MDGQDKAAGESDAFIFFSQGGRTVVARTVSAGTRDLGRVKAAWHAGLEELPATGGGMLGGPGHGSARLPLYWVLLPLPATFEGLVPPSLP